MNCFVVGTGRCGTSSFYQAARHIKGWTAGHESAAGYVGPPVYPDKHIEVDAQLVYRIPELQRLYPDARFVHLIRNREECVQSLSMASYQVMRAYAYQWHQIPTKFGIRDIAESFYDRTNELITALVPDAFVMRLDQLPRRWGAFNAWLGTEYRSSVSTEFNRIYNPGVARGRDSYLSKGDA